MAEERDILKQIKENHERIFAIFQNAGGCTIEDVVKEYEEFMANDKKRKNVKDKRNKNSAKVEVEEKENNYEENTIMPPPRVPVKKTKIKKERKTTSKNVQAISENEETVEQSGLRRSTRKRNTRSMSVVLLNKPSIIVINDSPHSVNEELLHNKIAKQVIKKEKTETIINEEQQAVAVIAESTMNVVTSPLNETFVVDQTNEKPTDEESNETFVIAETSEKKIPKAISPKEIPSVVQQQKEKELLTPVKSKIHMFEKMSNSATKIPQLTISGNKTRSGTKTAKDNPFKLKITNSAEPKQKLSSNSSGSKLRLADEAAKKKQALIQAIQEEKRQKREAKQLKAQQLREQLEKQKQLQLMEIEKEKERKKNKALMEIQERRDKQRELLAQKQKAAAQRALKEKEKQEHANNYKNLPLYKQFKMPPLPTADYRVDEEKMSTGNCFNERENIIILKLQQKLENSLFQVKPNTPNLEELFLIINPEKLRRNSSAVWESFSHSTFTCDLNLTEEDSESA